MSTIAPRKQSAPKSEKGITKLIEGKCQLILLVNLLQLLELLSLENELRLETSK
jgi:hypothetical protein